MSKRIISHVPSPRLMETIGATNLKLEEAIGELVANCFDARYKEEKLTIIIDVRGDEIKVIDNGIGMTGDVLAKAITIGEDMSKHITRNEDAKGHFGMGFKAACSNLGKFYEIYTRPVIGNEECYVNFDIEEFSNRKSNQESWKTPIEEGSSYLENSPLGKAKHGTAFVIKNLNKEKRDALKYIRAVREYLGKAFKWHLENGDTIKTINDQEEIKVDAYTPDVFPGSIVKINESVFWDGKECQIRGWMGIDKHPHNDTNFGFCIYRKKQLLDQWNKDWFTPHLMTSRIIGEVEIDDIDATFYKQGIQQHGIWDVINWHMTEHLKGLVSASRAISQKGNAKKGEVRKKIFTELREKYHQNTDDSVFSEDEEDVSQTKVSVKVNASIKDSINYVVGKNRLTLKRGDNENGLIINISYVEKKNANLKIPFDYIFSEGDEEEAEPAELQVIIYSDYPVWSKKISNDLAKLFATSDAIYRMLTEKMDYEYTKAAQIRNDWLWDRMKD